MKQFPITYWYGIRKEHLSRERLIEAKECGFNTIECDYDRETNLQVLAWCDELGIKANVRDGRIEKALAGVDGWEEALDAMIADYAPFESLNRFFLRDEPVDEYFPNLARAAAYLHEHDPAHGEYINLLPFHALGPAEGEDFEARYRRHLRGFCETVKPTVLSYDNYNLKKTEVTSRAELGERREADVSRENRIRNGWEDKIFAAEDHPYFYNNLEIIREYANRMGVPWMNIILLIEHWHYRLPSEAEVRWEVFASLASGTQGLSYFTYWTPGAAHTEPWSYHNGIILSDGTRGEKYDIVKRINADIQALWAGLTLPLPGETDTPTEVHFENVFHVGGDADILARPFTGYGRIKSLTGGRLVAGFYAGERVLLCNKDYLAPATVTVETRHGGEIYRLDKSTGAYIACDKTLTIAPGDGELIAIR